MIKRNVLAVVVLIVFMTGCVGTTARMKNSSFMDDYARGNYEQAINKALEVNEENQDGALEDDVLLWDMQASLACFAQGDYTKTCELLDKVETMAKDEDLEDSADAVGKEATAAVLSNYLNDYTPTLYDKILINTYKGIAFSMSGDTQNARVEFNRAYDRQRRSVEEFKAEIMEKAELSKKELEKEEKDSEKSAEGEENTSDKGEKASEEKKGGIDMDATFANAKEKIYEAKGGSQWEPYADFVNPYTSYISGLFWLNAGADKSDMSKAVDSLSRVAGMSSSPVVESDLRLAKSTLSGKPVSDEFVWVIFENGLGPELEEFRLDIPLFLVKSDVSMASLALPKLKSRDAAFSHLTPRYAGEDKDKTVELASIDRVVETEFDLNYDALIMKSLVSLATKSAFQTGVSRVAGDYGAIINTFYSVLTTSADLRMWSALPKDIQVAKFSRTELTNLQLLAPAGDVVAEVDLPSSGNCVVFVRIPTSTTPAAVNVMTF